MKKVSKLTKVLSGVAGEYLVAGELSRRGLIASITLRNTKGVDILCSNSSASKSVAIQVKTNQGTDHGWLLSEKSESFYADNHFYVFVNLNCGDNPDYFIVPSKVVAKDIKRSHALWIKTPGKNGKPHNDSPMRRFEDKVDKKTQESIYKNKWSLLGL